VNYVCDDHYGLVCPDVTAGGGACVDPAPRLNATTTCTMQDMQFHDGSDIGSIPTHWRRANGVWVCQAQAGIDYCTSPDGTDRCGQNSGPAAAGEFACNPAVIPPQYANIPHRPHCRPGMFCCLGQGMSGDNANVNFSLCTNSGGTIDGLEACPNDACESTLLPRCWHVNPNPDDAPFCR
jgi:hypothetical protein